MNRNKGFTLIELIVVLVILAVLAAVLVPVIFIKPAKTANELFFEGTHELLDIKSFLPVNQDGYAYTDSTTVSFTWKNNKQEWIQTKLSKDMVRYNFDSAYTVPYCKFRWRGNSFVESDWVNDVVYVVLCLPQEKIVVKKYVIETQPPQPRAGW